MFFKLFCFTIFINLFCLFLFSFSHFKCALSTLPSVGVLVNIVIVGINCTATSQVSDCDKTIVAMVILFFISQPKVIVAIIVNSCEIFCILLLEVVDVFHHTSNSKIKS